MTVEGINTGLAEWLGSAAGIKRVQDAANPSENNGGITEGMNDTPTLQVYWQLGANGDEWQQATFGGGVIQTSLTYHADLLVQQRANLSEDMAHVLPFASRLWDRLHAAAQQVAGAGYFDVEGVRGFRFTAERVTFTYASVDYVGIRFIIELRLF